MNVPRPSPLVAAAAVAIPSPDPREYGFRVYTGGGRSRCNVRQRRLAHVAARSQLLAADSAQKRFYHLYYYKIKYIYTIHGACVHVRLCVAAVRERVCACASVGACVQCVCVRQCRPGPAVYCARVCVIVKSWPA